MIFGIFGLNKQSEVHSALRAAAALAIASANAKCILCTRARQEVEQGQALFSSWSKLERL